MGLDLGDVSDRIRQPRQTDWTIELDGFDVSRITNRLRFKDTISQPGEFILESFTGPKQIDDDAEIFVKKKDTPAFQGVVTSFDDSNSNEYKYRGHGPSKLIRGEPINQEFFDYNTDQVVQEVINSLDEDRIVVGVNEQLAGGTNAVNVRADDEDALTFLNRVIMSYGGDWNVSYDADSDVYEFNVYNRLETDEVVKEYEAGGEKNNIEEITIKDVFDKEYDAVIVKGYGDGEDQVQAHFPKESEWPEDPEVFKYTDKTIVSDSEAKNVAENIYNEHTEWRNVYLSPANRNELLDLGDKVSVTDRNTGFSDEIRVVERKLNIDFGGRSRIDYVLSDRPIDMIEKVEDAKQLIKSESEYMQGSRNVWTDKEAGNASNTYGLKHRFHIPDDIKDIKDDNRLNGVKLDYSASPFRSDLSARIIDAEKLNVGDDENVFIEKGIMPDIGSTSAGGGGVVEESKFQGDQQEYEPGQWYDIHSDTVESDGASMYNSIDILTRPNISPDGTSIVSTYVRLEGPNGFYPDNQGIALTNAHWPDNDGNSYMIQQDSLSFNYFQPISSGDEYTLQAYFAAPDVGDGEGGTAIVVEDFEDQNTDGWEENRATIEVVDEYSRSGDYGGEFKSGADETNNNEVYYNAKDNDGMNGVQKISGYAYLNDVWFDNEEGVELALRTDPYEDNFGNVFHSINSINWDPADSSDDRRVQCSYTRDDGGVSRNKIYDDWEDLTEWFFQWSIDFDAQEVTITVDILDGFGSPDSAQITLPLSHRYVDGEWVQNWSEDEIRGINLSVNGLGVSDGFPRYIVDDIEFKSSEAEEDNDITAALFWDYFIESRHTHSLEEPAHENIDREDGRFSGDNTNLIALNELRSIDNEITIGDEADEVRIIIDGVDRTDDIYGQSSSGTAEDEGIDILDYLAEPLVGPHTVKIEPIVNDADVSTSYIRSRVLFDHYKKSD